MQSFRSRANISLARENGRSLAKNSWASEKSRESLVNDYRSRTMFARERYVRERKITSVALARGNLGHSLENRSLARDFRERRSFV